MRVTKTTMLTLLSLIFILPMLAAWLAYSKGCFISGRTTNQGVLLDPPYSISALSLRTPLHQEIGKTLTGKWWLMYFTVEPGSELAKKNIYYMRQVRQATGKERDRVELALITDQENKQFSQWYHQHYPNLYQFLSSREKMIKLQRQSSKTLDLAPGSLYLVDPLGNIMMLYAPNAAPKGILKDLIRVLKVSQIG